MKVSLGVGRAAAVMVAFVLFTASTASALTFHVVAPYDPPPPFRPTGWSCSFPSNTTNPLKFTPIVPTTNPYQTTGQFSTANIADYNNVGNTSTEYYDDAVRTVATAISILTRNRISTQNRAGWILDVFPQSGTVNDARGQLRETKYWAQDPFGDSWGSEDTLYNGFCGVGGGYYLACDGTSYFESDSACYSPANNRFLPVLDGGEIASRVYDGMVGVISTNVEEWDGQAYAYGEDNYYVVIGYNITIGGTTLLLYNQRTKSKTWHYFEAMTIPQRWSTGSISPRRAVTVINSTSSTKEVITQFVGVDAIIDHYN